MLNKIMQDVSSRMQKSIDSLEIHFSKIRTGRANPSILDTVKVDYYGSEVPISQVSNINVEDARTLTVQPWEQNMVAAVEKAIMQSDLGVNPSTNGNLIRVPMPVLTEERRKEFTKVARNEAENARVSVRNIRRDINNDIKKLNKEKEITDDELHQSEDEVQKITDTFIEKIDSLLSDKEKSLLEI